MITSADKKRARRRRNYLKHREARLSYAREYRKRNRARVLAALRRWHATHRDHEMEYIRLHRTQRREYSKRWAKKHPEKKRALAHAWHVRNYDKMRARKIANARRWRLDNPTRYRQSDAKRRNALTESYVRTVLAKRTGISGRCFPLAMVKAKQAQLRLRKLVKEMET
jgi:hypothetical protein